MQDGPELFVCRLTPGVQEFANLDLVLDEYTELTCVGAPLHVTGMALVTTFVASQSGYLVCGYRPFTSKMATRTGCITGKQSDT